MGFFEDPSIAIIAAFILFILTSIGVVLVLWIALPFSVFGIKGFIKKTIGEQEETNRLLRSILDTLRKIQEQGADGPEKDKQGPC
jgi:hypothetical protein